MRAAIGADFLGALGTPVLDGRGFTEVDRDGAPPVAVVSQTLARRYWGERSPIGARIRFPGRRLGQDTEQIYAERLGLDSDRVARLRADGVI